MTQVCDRENDGPEAAAPAVGQSRLLVLASSMLARATTRMIFGCSLRTRQGARPIAPLAVAGRDSGVAVS
jgi:hypothetical protein